MTKYICLKSASTLFKNDFFQKGQIYFVDIESITYGVSNPIIAVYDSEKFYMDSCTSSFIFEHLIPLAEYREQQINEILNDET